MSGQFLKDWAQRITNNETLIVREELINLITKNNIIKTTLEDQHWNDNLLLPNFIKEKDDNWDIDIFLYIDNDKVKTENIVTILNNEKRILKINKNDKIWSFLLDSKSIWKKIQIDLHIIKNTKENLDNYFNYFRVPYMFFVLWMIFRKLNIKLGTNWIDYAFEQEKHKAFFKLETSFPIFLEKVFSIKISHIKKINSYNQISEYINSLGLAQYDFFNLEKTKWKYLRKMKWNDKLHDIVSNLDKPTKKYEEYQKQFRKTILTYYPDIPKLEKDFLKKIKKIKSDNLIRVNNLKTVFNTDDLKLLKIEQKKLIPLIKDILPELVILNKLEKKLSANLKNKEIYLVWWAVRDIFLWKGCKDWDLSWNYTSKEFQEIIWWNITEKFWTVFVIFDWLEIEYTPFRKESNYDWRKPWKIEFNVNIETDSTRRDFTMNSLYLNLKNLELLDFYNWLDDLKKRLIKAVWNPEDRFEEDYLRILRAIRLKTKINWNIEEKTYISMIKNSNKIKQLSIERVVEEYTKWFNLKDNSDYLLTLDKFYKDNKLIPDLLEFSKSIIDNNEKYTIIYYLLWKNIKSFKKIDSKENSRWKKIFIYIENIVNKDLNKTIKNLNNIESLAIFLFNLLSWFLYNSKKEEHLFIIKTYINFNIINWNILKDEGNKILILFKELMNSNIVYTLIELNETFNIEDIIKKENLLPKQIKNRQLEEIKKQFTN